jgi:Firmicute plasmid replication protein (RepL)
MPGKPRGKATSLYNEVGQVKTLYYQPLEDKPKGKPQFKGAKFMMTGLQTYKIIRELHLPASARLVLDWLCEHAKFGNHVTDWTHAMIGEECGVYRTRVSTTMRQLEDNGLIIVFGRGQCTLNPYLWYRGKLEEQQEACERWDQYLRERGELRGPVAVAK